MSFPPIIAIFYSEFHPVQGPKVSFEVPEGFVLSTSANSTSSPSVAAPPYSPTSPLLDFDEVSEYLIPKVELCDKLVTLRTEKYTILGYPVRIVDRKYERNALLFNLAFVFEQDAETTSYEPIVRKIARVLRSLETESEFLSNHMTRAYLQNIIEQVIEDLNAYCECQIPINDANIINLKLFPMYPPPPPVYDWQVPVYIVDLATLDDEDWDMSMRKITKYINGINHVKKIAQLTDVDPSIARSCMQHLLYYGCIIMIDIFQFSNIYAVRPEIIRMVSPIPSFSGHDNLSISHSGEYPSYYLQQQHSHSQPHATSPSPYHYNHGIGGGYPTGIGVGLGDQSQSQIQSECRSYISKPNAAAPSFAKILSLYCSLKHGLTVKEWIAENQVESLGIDVRRFITFGVIKGFLYRVHKYPICTPRDDHQSMLPTILKRFLDGSHHYDEICTMFQYSAREMDELLNDAKSKVLFIFK